MPTPAAQNPANRSTNRADIQSNLLADRIERWFIQIKPMLPWILAGIVAVVAIAIIVSLISGQAAQREATGWSDIYFAESSIAQLETVSEDFEGTTAAEWARQWAADAKLNEALQQIYTDRTIAIQKLAEAREEYQAIAGSSRDPILTIRSNLGIAKTYDAEGDGENAAKAYQEVLGLPDVTEQLQKSVTERLAFIQSERGKEFFAWFKENKPAAPRPTGAAEDLNKLPDTPDIKFSTEPGSPLGSAGSSEAPALAADIKLPVEGEAGSIPATEENKIELPAIPTPEVPAAE
jgi:PAS domain-containing protein